ncbi:MAG: ACP S-malonyltransferase [Ignavibacteriaceae bacterium]|nr:ACP S-malonyltransferase [Ignavibacteriaceae bacterium]
MGKRAFLFPGQGSQYVGMAADLFENSVEVKEMIRTADGILGRNLSYIMFNGPEEELKQTENTQPAIFIHSVVIAGLLRRLDFDGAAGHSLGEYSALVACGALQFHDAVSLVNTRGKAMQAAGAQYPGTMAAVLGLNGAKLEEICTEVTASTGVVQCANFNSPGQIVISGSVDGVRKAMELAKAGGAKLVKELVVSGAFHSPLMVPAGDALKLKLDITSFYDARKPVYANVTAKPVTSKDEIKDLLYRQLTSPVRWEETIKNMAADGFDEFVEVGPGKVLQGLVKRIVPDAKVSGIDKFAEMELYR